MAELTERQRANLDLTQRAFSAFRADAPEDLLQLADPDVEIFSSPDLANPGSYRGHDGLIAWITAWVDAWDDLEIEARSMEPLGERHVVTSAHQTATGKGSGVPVEMDVAFLTEVRGETYVALHLYPSRDEAVKVAKAREA
jgi:ketosteroid isomerase-like protein